MLKLSMECNYLIVKGILKVRAAYGEHVVCVSGFEIGGYAPRCFSRICRSWSDVWVRFWSGVQMLVWDGALVVVALGVNESPAAKCSRT